MFYWRRIKCSSFSVLFSIRRDHKVRLCRQHSLKKEWRKNSRRVNFWIMRIYEEIFDGDDHTKVNGFYWTLFTRRLLLQEKTHIHQAFFFERDDFIKQDEQNFLIICALYIYLCDCGRFEWASKSWWMLDWLSYIYEWNNNTYTHSLTLYYIRRSDRRRFFPRATLIMVTFFQDSTTTIHVCVYMTLLLLYTYACVFVWRMHAYVEKKKEGKQNTHFFPFLYNATLHDFSWEFIALFSVYITWDDTTPPPPPPPTFSMSFFFRTGSGSLR